VFLNLINSNDFQIRPGGRQKGFSNVRVKKHTSFSKSARSASLLMKIRVNFKLYYSFIHSLGMCRMRRFLAVLRSFFHPSLLCTFLCHPSPPTIHPSSLTSSCHLFLHLPLTLVAPKFTYNTIWRFLFSSILCTCPNQHNPFNLIVSITVGFFNTCINFFIG